MHIQQVEIAAGMWHRGENAIEKDVNVKNLGLVIGAALAAVTFLPPATSHATLIINVGGVNETFDPTNTFTSFSCGSPGKPPCGPETGNFNVNNLGVAGVNAFGGSGEVFDLSALDISTAGSGTLTIRVTETNLSAGTLANFTGLFSGLLANITATRSIFLDTTNAGLETTLLGSTTTGDGSFSSLQTLSGLFSLTEEIDLTATAAGAKLSSDDSVSVSVPEPASLTLLGTGLLGLGFFARWRRKRQTR